MTQNINIANNVFGNGGLFQVYALDKETHIPADDMNITIDGNLFNKREDSHDPTMVAWGGSDSRTLHRFETPRALQEAKNSSWNKAITDESVSIKQMNEAIAAASTIAVPLPDDVARASGHQPGVRVIGQLQRNGPLNMAR